MISKDIPDALKKINWLTYMILNHLCANGILFGIPEKPYIKNFVRFNALNKNKWSFDKNQTILSFEKMLIRYFQYYGPATLEDFSHWSGLQIKFIN